MLKFRGFSRDSTGAVLPNADVDLMLTANDQKIDDVISDAGGYFEVCSAYAGVNHYILAYKSGSPDVVGATVNTLQPT